jgi:peptide/nickel transport system substrate-binding protein
MSESSNPLSAGWSRRDALRLGLMGAGAVVLGPTLAACGGGSGSASSPGKASPTAFAGGPSTAGSPIKGGRLTVGLVTQGKSETISPLATLNLPDFARVLNLYDLMFAQEAGGKASNALIEQAETNADATVWNLKVRQGVTWHDGKPLTADDIVYTIQHSWGSKDNLFNGGLAQLVDFAGVKKTGQYELTVPLKMGVAKFPTIACFVNCAVVQNGTKDFNNGMGTGPFKLQSFDPGKRSVFTRNENYWGDGGPYVDELVIDSSFSSDEARTNALLAGQVDIVPQASFTLAKANASSGRIVVGNQPGPGTTPLIMRVDKGALSNPDLRRALKLIPDRGKYVDAAYAGYGTVGNDLMGYTNQFFADSIKAKHDPEQAKSILKKAGLEGIKLTLDTSAAVAGMNETSALFAQDAKAAGVSVKLNTIDPATFFTPAEGVFERPFAVSYYATGLNSLPLYYSVAGLPGGIYNETHFGTPAQVKQIAAALKEQDDAKAEQLWLDVQQTQITDGGYIVPSNFNYVDAYGLKVRGIQTTSNMNCDNFNFKTAWVAKS